MLFKVELHPDVQAFLDRSCTAAERRELRGFFRTLGEEPYVESRVWVDDALSRYAMRAATLGAIRVVFSHDRMWSKVRVRQCQRILRIAKPPDSDK